MDLIVFEILFTTVVVALLAVLYKTEQTNSLANRRLAAIEAAGDGIGIVDHNGILTYMNKALMDLHEIRDGAEYIGRSWSNLYNEKGKEEIETIVMPYLEKHNSWRGESPIVTKAGQLIIAEMFLTRLPNGGFIGTARDVTQRKRDEAEKEALQKKFVQAQKMEIIGALTGGIAHDFNNMLTVISGNVEILEEDITKDSPLRSNLLTVRRAINRGAELTQRLLAFSRQQILSPQNVNLNKIIPDTINMMKRTLGEQVELAFQPQADLWHAMIDTGQIENALINLCINARDAMPKGGRIAISTDNVEIEKEKSEGQFYMAEGQYVRISVTDTGQGIPEEIINKVFDPFFTTKEVGQGSGLGLSMVYGFTKQSGGYVTIDSEVGQGTTISLYFPKGEKQETVPEQQIPEASRHHKGEGQILLVEDQADVLEFTTILLGRFGYKVRTAKNGPEAILMLDEIDNLDLLITDVIMPGGINGKELAEEARAKFPDLRVLYISGYTHENLQDEIADMRTDFLPKPYTKDILASKIRGLLDS